MKNIAPYMKAVLAFASLVITNALTNYAANATPLPVENGHMDWGQLAINLGTTAVGTFSVYQWPWKGDATPSPAGKHEKP